MRQTVSGLVAALAVVAASTAPAMACGGGLFQSSSSCSSCGHAYVSPCSQGYYGGGSYNYASYYGTGYQRLPEPTQQYYYANQGPTFTGPGNYAPYPTYQETAVTGWQGYERGYDYGYDGGRYANATNHYYDGAPAWQGPAIYSYRPRPQYRSQRSYRYGYSMRPRVNYGYAQRYSSAPRYGYQRSAGSRHHAAPQFRHGGQSHFYQRPLRRLN